MFASSSRHFARRDLALASLEDSASKAVASTSREILERSSLSMISGCESSWTRMFAQLSSMRL
jgi:hypothetical protein